MKLEMNELNEEDILETERAEAGLLITLSQYKRNTIFSFFAFFGAIPSGAQ